MGRLDERVCVITGSTGGIGAAAVKRFHDEGGILVGADLLPDTQADEWIALDVTDEDAVSALYDGVRNRYGHVDVLFNNAGISPEADGSLLDADPSVWQRVQDINVRGVANCCKHGIPHLLDSGGGSVINTASFVAVMGSVTSQAAYTASKGAVLALTRELGVQFGRRGVRVNALCPGPVSTPMLEEVFARDPVQAQRRLAHLPLGRFATPEEIANAALFLASDESSYINASTFLVDGGASGAYLTVDA